MAEDYKYPISQCDIPAERHPALQSFRDKRRAWVSWISTDEHHAIWTELSSMVWVDVSFKILTHLALSSEDSALNNQLLAESLLNGNVATQVLSIRRLVDRRNDDIISLWRLVKDIDKNFNLITRENYVCYDGLPYDYERARLAWMTENSAGGWTPREGPLASAPSRALHRQFDTLMGIDPAKRSREDRLPKSLLKTVGKWLDDSGADDLARWSHVYLAHAGGPEARKQIADLQVTANKITDAIKALSRVTEAISALLLGDAGRSNALMPTAQFDQFEKLDNPVMEAGGDDAARELWDQLANERDAYLSGIDEELLERSGIPKR
jgi:hypothetical protein